MPQNNSKMNKTLLSLTIPNIITNITVPLLGMVDLAIVGRVDGGIYLGAVAIGTTIFNLLYWGFGFLRVGTTGFTAQAFGNKNMSECSAVLIRSSVVAVLIGLLFWCLQFPIFYLVEQFMNISPNMLGEVENYYYVRIWAAPATLMLYCMKGWFLGMQNSKIPMWMALVINLVNIVCSYWFAFHLGMGLKGVALGTLVAQYSGLLFGLIALVTRFSPVLRQLNLRSAFNFSSMRSFFSINSDIFIRSMGLIAVFTFFTSASSAMGDDILNANTLLLQLFTLFSYIMDGFAYAGESLTGRFYGARDAKNLRLVIRLLIRWGIAFSLIFTLLYATALRPILSLFTENGSILDVAMQFKYWVVAVPFCGFLAFTYDGVATGMLLTKALRNTIVMATILFFALYYSLTPFTSNNALWIAFLAFLIFRGLSLHFIISRKELP